MNDQNPTTVQDPEDLQNPSPAEDYKQSLNLPQTEFPMQANLARREPEMLAQWEKKGLYARVQNQTAGRPPYWFVDGPPYANGDMHLGHAVNNVLKDAVVKAARLDGRCAPFVPGWDCHGLPIELQVEKKFGKVGTKLDAPQFRAQCREYAASQVDRQRADLKKLGILADWERPYLTMQPAYEAEQLRVLARIVENGHIVRGFKPVHWCADCGSSLAEAEVEYQDKESTAIFVAFAAADAGDVARRFGLAGPPPEGIRFVVWTTTPWSLPGNQAIAVNPDFPYALVDFGTGASMVIADGLVEAMALRLGVAAPRRLGTLVPGAALEGAKALHPFATGRLSPILLGRHVTLEAGTGLVHTAPAHGIDDFNVCREYGIPVINPVGMDSCFKADTPVVPGMHLKKSEAPILEALRQHAALVHVATIIHSYPHCWRHKTPLYTLATAQWFMAMDGAGDSVRAKALRAIENDVRFIPEWGRARIHGMVAERPDWCISRQRTWGVPLALLVHRQTQEPHPRSAELLRRIADRVEKEGLESWFGSTPADWLDAGEAAQYDRCPDTLDVWFDSGSAHQCSFVSTNPAALDAEGLAPLADIYLEGSDQHRGWFQSSLLTSIAMRGRAPYRAVLTHGFTVDEQGRKMSKSLGNGIEPQEITKTLGADVLRLWVASSDYSGEIVLSKDLLKRIADAYRRIRNTARYLLSNLHDFVPDRDTVAPAELLEVDRWALSQASALQTRLRRHYADAEFHLVYQELHNYCVTDLGGLYLDILKDRLYTLPPKSVARRSAQTALLHIAEALVRWIAPILSFTADEIWQLMPGDRSVSIFAQKWHDFPAAASSIGDADWKKLRALRDQAQKEIEDQRNRKTLGSALEADVTVFLAPEWLRLSPAVEDELRFWFITSGAGLVTNAEEFQARSGVELPQAALEAGWAVSAAPTAAPKCARCWHRRADVGSDATHPRLCARCVVNLGTNGEARSYF